MELYELDTSDSEYGPLAGSCKQRNEPSEIIE
jgi:hypothetical protein